MICDNDMSIVGLQFISKAEHM